MMLSPTLLVAAFVAVGEAFSFGTPDHEPKAVKNAYIVQLKVDSSLSVRSDHDMQGHEAFHKRALGIDYAIRQQFTNPTLFYGLSIQIKQNDTAEVIKAKLNSIEGVENVWPVLEYNVYSQDRRSNEVPFRRRAAGTARSDTSTSSMATNSLPPPKVTGTSDLLSHLKMSDVDKLHALGIKGKGMKVGIIDTGVDYRHPSLGGGFGPGFKIAGGHAFIDDEGTQVSVADPLATCFGGGHGTHVSGIVGMQDPVDIGFGLTGVAPEAEIYMYRVFSCAGNAYTDGILSAFGQAQTDGVDVVSLSLGQVDYWQIDDPFQLMSTALVSGGVAVVASAGNDGVRYNNFGGLFAPSSPSNGKDVISVGSIQNTQFPSVYRATDTLGGNFSYASVWPITISQSSLDVYIIDGTGTGCDASEWIKASQTVSDVSKTIVIFHNSGGEDCPFSTKYGFWMEYGFAYIMDYTLPSANPYDKQYVLLEQSDSSTYYTNLLQDDAEGIISNYAKAGGYPNYQLEFASAAVESAAMLTAGMISDFSSYGPTWDTLAMKPQLSGPGATILSTWPLGFNAGYAALRGTSMAAPFVAASYALVKSQLPHLSVLEIRQLLQSTATPVTSGNYPSLLTTAVQQGSGLINPYKAINYASSIAPTQFELGDADDFVGTKYNFTITNSSPSTHTYHISHQGAAMMEYHPFGVHPFLEQQPLWDTQPQSETYASLRFSACGNVTIPSGESATIFFKVTPPANFDESKVPVISGFISIESSLGEAFTLPYEGLPYSRWNAKYLDLSSHSLSDTVSTPWPVMWEYDTEQGNFTNYNGSGIMTFDKKYIIIRQWEVGPLFNVLQPTKDLRAEVFSANTTFVPTYYGYDTSAEWDYLLTNETYRYVMEDGVTPTFGLIDGANPWRPYLGFINWEEMTVRSNDPYWEDTGGVAPTSVGDYRVLISVLKWGGNGTNLDHWESWLSPIVRVLDSSLPNTGIGYQVPH